MKHRLLGSLVAGALLVGLVAGTSLAAQGGTDRYQVGTTVYNVAVLDTYMHTFTVTTNPCDGTIAITGATPLDSAYYTTETVTGTLANGVISFTATYQGPYNTGYSWSGSFPVAGGALSGEFTGTVTMGTTTSTTFANHGAYVSSMGGGADAAHSCIGMPMVSGAADRAALTTKIEAIEARLLALFQGLEAKLQANPHAAVHAVPAIQKQITALTAGTRGPAKALATSKGSAPKASKPTLPAAATNHPNRDSHPSKP